MNLLEKALAKTIKKVGDDKSTMRKKIKYCEKCKVSWYFDHKCK